MHIASSTVELRDNTIRDNNGFGIASGGNAAVTPSDPRTANTLSGNGQGDLFGFGPAVFQVTELSISPAPPFLVGTEATVTAKVTNVGGETGTKPVWLQVDGSKAGEISLTLNPGQSERVSFKHTFETSKKVTICIADGCAAEI